MSDIKNQSQFNIELGEDVAGGIYSNLAIITHSPAEFVIDFVRIMPGVPKPKVRSRIILTPEHAKRLVAALNDNIAKYEAVNGPIREVKGSGPVMPVTFGGPTAQA
ncbi:MAG TPA: DUF3467 domain-containing protein [Bacteroidales bacterium]|jgi:hypothetical protein|nr:DUF3467 domain-containing protein [Bacteroidales bacterium]MDI9533948.1 DUF3467 domain-containing protein [Bacteroidota bacterium]MBK7733640.1 DUF3467 domain-containing protein [Bacteroidales bacterium]MBP7035693.1 DUF3467 domain-containing protein [Bacteroidales bacterium]MBP8708677.1 DUF3467 domain-containing protein [Bacteroidales bacterium]